MRSTPRPSIFTFPTHFHSTLWWSTPPWMADSRSKKTRSAHPQVGRFASALTSNPRIPTYSNHWLNGFYRTSIVLPLVCTTKPCRSTMLWSWKARVLIKNLTKLCDSHRLGQLFGLHIGRSSNQTGPSVVNCADLFRWLQGITWATGKRRFPNCHVLAFTVSM